MIRKAAVGVGLMLILSPLFVSAQSITLSLEARQQLLYLATQLVQIAEELAAAQARGPAYTAGAEFRQQTANWIARVSQIQQGVSAVVAGIRGPAYPSSPYTPTPQYSTPVSGSANLSVSHKGQPTGTVLFTIKAFSTDGCPPANFTLQFGDGQQQVVSFPPSCSARSQTIAHTYPQLGSYTAYLTSGTFQTSVPVLVAPSDYSLRLTAEQDDESYSVLLTAEYDSGARCEENDYKITWGDGKSRTVSFSDDCDEQTETFTHTYEGSGTYTIRAVDDAGRSASLSFKATTLAAAGAGDQALVLNVHAEGAEGTTAITDSSPSHHTLSVQGGARVEADDSMVGGSSLYLDGDAYVSTADDEDFDYGSEAFTLSLWFKPYTLPASGNQAALLVQANSNALDSSLGGAGLVLYGNSLYYVGRIGSATYHPLYNDTVGTGPLTAGKWYHAAIVRSGNTVRLYLDGSLQGSLNVSGSANDSEGTLAIGRYGGYSGNYFNGLIDEVQISKGVAKWTSSFTPPSDQSTNGVTTNATSYASGSTVTVSWNTDETPKSKDFIGIAYVSGHWSMTFNGENRGWFWTDSSKSGSKTLVAPAAGTYQLVHYVSDTGNGGESEEVGRSATFTVY